MIETKRRILKLIKEAEEQFTGTGKALLDIEDYVAEYLTANGVMLVDTEAVDLVTNRGPIRTAFGMPLDELADLIRAKQRGRIIELPCNVGDTVYLPWMYGGQKGIALCSAKRIVVRGEKSYVETSLSSDDDGFLEECNYGDFYFTDFGKTVFLTREEAEKALERSRG